MNTTRLALTVALACMLSAPAADAATKRKSAAKKKRPAATKKVPAAEPEDTFTPPDEPAPDSDVPVAPQAAAPAPVAPATPAAPKKLADVPAPARAATSNAVAIFGVARQSAATDSAAKLEDTLTRRLGSAGDVQFVDLATAFPPPEPQGNR
ncbi:hypothetical protein [Corallococcus sp. CA041A]|uniref:hypothetical protein n=1 Tax=Corallococcus sp. CA041A TaxID=2316727 RepID=UPI001F185FF4|nr:hypothetical protein [Corallococcus sp. CA041A]